MSQRTTLPGAQQAPLLENGARLSRPEFERRYQAMPQVKKAELIEGVVSMPSPVRLEHHGEPHMSIVGLLWTYRSHTPGVRGGDNSSVRLDLDNEPQPDAFLFIPGGDAHIDDEDYLAGSPELVAEIAASTVSIDLGKKMHAYRRNGVKEYLVWRVEDRAIDWFVLRAGQYERMTSSAGFLKSAAFPGLWLDPDALVAGDFARVHAVLQQGMHSPEHAAFVAALTS